MAQEYNLWQQLVLGATSPFRKGANILAQNWGSAFTGKDMSQSQNRGKFLEYLASALTPEEQEQISNKPYLEAIKSSAGMASTLMPYTKIGGVANVGTNIANPTISKLAQLATRGSIEGTVGGFGYSRQGKELQDTLLGMGIGTVGEVAGGLISDPTFRKGMGQELKKANTGKYSAELNLGNNKPSTIDPLIEEAKKYKTPEEFVRTNKALDRIVQKKDLTKMGIGGEYEYATGRKVVDPSIVNDVGSFVETHEKLHQLDTPLATEISNLSTEQIRELAKRVSYVADTAAYPLEALVDNPRELSTVMLQEYTLNHNEFINSLPEWGNKIDDIMETRHLVRSLNLSENQLSDIWNQAHSTGQVSEDAMKSADKIGDYIFEGRPGNDLYKQQMEILLNKNAKTPKLKQGVSYSKQAMLAKRSKTSRKIPVTSDDEGLRESLRNTYSSILKKR